MSHMEKMNWKGRPLYVYFVDAKENAGEYEEARVRFTCAPDARWLIPFDSGNPNGGEVIQEYALYYTTIAGLRCSCIGQYIQLDAIPLSLFGSTWYKDVEQAFDVMYEAHTNSVVESLL